MHKRFHRAKLTSAKHWLIAGVTLVAVLHYVFVIMDLSGAGDRFTPFFDLDREHNLPTFYSSVLLACIGIFSGARAYRARKLFHRLFWLAFSAMFLYWSVDEFFVLHEQLGAPVRELLDISAGSPLYHAWVVVALGVIGLVALTAFVFTYVWRNLLEPTMKQMILLLIIYMGGIVFFEVIGTKAYSHEALYRLVFVPAEELYEITMASLLLLVVIGYRRRGWLAAIT